MKYLEGYKSFFYVDGDLPNQEMFDWVDEYKYNNSHIELSSKFTHMSDDNYYSDINTMRDEFLKKFHGELSGLSYTQTIDVFNSCL